MHSLSEPRSQTSTVEIKVNGLPLDPDIAAGSSESLISEAAIRAMYRHWRAEMGL